MSDDSVTDAVARMVASATREADAMRGRGRYAPYLLLRTLAEIHRRAAEEITVMADACQPPPSAPARHRQN